MSRTVTLDDLLSHRDWLKALARSLVKDEAAADDLVQETWLAALRRPPDAGPGLRSWLREVIRNRSRQEHRTASRRERRDAAAARPEALTGAVDVVERAEIQAVVSRLVLELPDAERRVVLLRYHDDLGPSAIAQELEIPVETVKTRLKRGLARLRGLLEREFRRDGKDWRLVLLPLSLGKRRGAPTGAAGLVLAGAALMSKKLVIAAAVLAALTGVVLWSRGDSGRAAESATATATAAQDVTPERTRRRAPVAAPSEEPARTDATQATDDQPARRVALRVTLSGLDAAVPGEAQVDVGVRHGDTSTHVSVVAWDEPALELDLGQAFAKGAPSEIELSVDHPAYFPLYVRVPVSPARVEQPGPLVLEHEVRLERAGIVTGVVTGPGGEPLEGVHVLGGLLGDGAEIEREGPVVRTDASGRYRTRVWPRRDVHVVAATYGLEPAVHTVSAAMDGETIVPPLELARGHALSGTVRFAGGEVPRRGDVLVVASTAASSLVVGPYTVAVDGAHSFHSMRRVRWDEGGRFRMTGASAGVEYRVTPEPLLATSALCEAAETRVTLPADPLDLVLAGARLVVACTAGGRPLPGMTVSVDGDRGSTYLPTDEHGRGWVFGVPGTTLRIRSGHPDYEPVDVSVKLPAAGLEVVQTLELSPRAPRATLVLDVGDGAAGLRHVSGTLTSDEGVEFILATRDASGRYVAQDLPAGSFALSLRPGTQTYQLPGFFQQVDSSVELVGGGETRVRLPLRPAGRLVISAKTPEGSAARPRCVVRDADGTALRVTYVHRSSVRLSALGSGWKFIDRRSGFTSVEEGLLRGVNEIAPALPPGKYRIELSGRGYRPLMLEAEIRAGEVTTLEPTVHPE